MPKRCNDNSSIITSKTSSSCECSVCLQTNTGSCQCSVCQSKTCTNTTCTNTTCTDTKCSNSSTCPTSTCPTSTCPTSTCSTSTSSSSSSSCDSISSTDGSDCESSSEEEILGKKKFEIKFGSKCGHDHEHEINGNKAIYVNGKLAPILKLTRGYVYYFNIIQKCSNDDYANSFVLTKNPVGKFGCLTPEPLCDSFDPVTHGCVKYHVTNKTPKYFYYQSASNAFMGGLVLVEDC